MSQARTDAGEVTLTKVVLALAATCALGAAVFVATVLAGRTSLFWPGARWLLPFTTTSVLQLGLWWARSRSMPGDHRWRWQAAAWPALALLPVALAAVAFYVDDVSNHVVASSVSTRQTLVTYAALLLGGGEAAFWVSRLSRRRPGTVGGPAAVVAVGIAAGIYLHASVFRQWPPFQGDLNIALRAARELVAGTVPYHLEISVWADRTHLVPSTLVLLFGPLALLPGEAAHIVFFVANQVTWLLTFIMLARFLAPAGARLWWLAGSLAVAAGFWPLQESIRFGQPDGLIVLLNGAAVLLLTPKQVMGNPGSSYQERPGVNLIEKPDRQAVSDRSGSSSRDSRHIISWRAVSRQAVSWPTFSWRQIAAGAALGLALQIKPVGYWLPLVFLLHGRWRVLLLAGAVAGGLALATLPVTGVASWRTFLLVDVPDILPGTVRGTNIPLASFHARFFVARASLSDGEPAPAYAIVRALNLGATALGLLLLWRLRQHRSGAPARRWLLDASLGITLTLLVGAFAWQHYASWLVIPLFALSLPSSWRPLSTGQRLVAGLLSGVGVLLISLEDGRLVSLLSPLLERWPALLGFYTAGLVAIAAAIALARLGGARDTEPALPPIGEPDTSHR